MESCKKLVFRGRDVSIKIPNHFNLVSDNLALGLQLLSFSLFLFSVAEKELLRDLFPYLWIYYIYTYAWTFSMADRSHLFIPSTTQMRAGDLYLALTQGIYFLVQDMPRNMLPKAIWFCHWLLETLDQLPVPLNFPGNPNEHKHDCFLITLIM